MTALNDVLKAEQQADERIEVAKKEGEKTLAAAQVRQQEVLATEKAGLEKQASEAEEVHRVRIGEQVKKIQAETEAQVLVTKKRFADKRGAIKTLLLQRFQ